MSKHIYDMIILGGGPGGYTAALYAARAGLDVLVLERLGAGGQMAQTHTIDNYPGFPQGIDGFTLARNMQEQAERFGAKSEYADVQGVDLLAQPRKISTDVGDFLGKALVIATGAGAKELGIPLERELTGRGVAYCAACDGMFYKGKTVMVVGGGNSAAADALLLSRIAKRVILVHRRSSLRAAKIYHKSLTEAENVEFLWNSAVVGLLRDGNLTGVRVKDLLTGQEREMDVDGLFISIGRQPASELFRNQLELDENGYIQAGEDTKTPIPGVYAVGDVRTKPLRQIVTAVSDGAIAVHHATEFLNL